MPSNQDRSRELEARLHALCDEDNFAHGLPVADNYPVIESRDVSLFESDLRDWGFVYGLAFGLAMSAYPELSHQDAAELAYSPARTVFRRWSGEIEDPVLKRENAIRNLVRQFNEAKDHRALGEPLAMSTGLHSAIDELADWARG
jgi:hypothetical protein